ncbi:glycoside hydrolase superfamily, partial [Mycena filopes]
GYGPDSCSKNNRTECISNCDGKAECGPNAVDAAHFACPLNVCCSQWGFCGTTDEFCGTGCTSGCGTPTEPQTGCVSGSSLNRVIGYYESWALGQACNVITPEELPGLIQTALRLVGLLDIAPGGTYPMIVPASPSDIPLYTRITGLKAVNPALHTYISIGGWTFNASDPGPTFTTFSNLSSSEAHRMVFTASLINFMSQFGFDGVDIDWEYPAAPERGGSPADTQNFVTLLGDIRAAFDAAAHLDWGITFTAPSSYFYMRNFDIPAMLQHANWVNVMTYDLHGTWDKNDIWIGPYLLAHTNLTEMEQTMELFWRTGVPSSSVVLGIGFYGRSFTVSNPDCTEPGYSCTFSGGGKPGPCTASSGTLSYSEITDIIDANGLVGQFDQASGAKYITWDTDQWVSYDDSLTLNLKVQFADQHCLGGVMVWSADQDTPTFDAINNLLGDKAELNILDGAAQAVFQTVTLVPNGQNCAPTTNCGNLCPNGFVQSK